MTTLQLLKAGPLRRFAPAVASATRTTGLAWTSLPARAGIYVAAVIATGAAIFIALLPAALPRPGLFALLLVAAAVTSAWKVNLPIPLASGSTLSVSYAADLMALLLLGPRAAILVAVAGALTQCTINVKQAYPIYRTAFSMAAEAITMALTGLVYVSLGGGSGQAFDLASLARPLVAAIATYFVMNTGLIAAAIALSSNRRWWRVWRDDFLWSGASFMVAGGAGAAAAVVIQHGQYWQAVLLMAPVYLTYRTYRVFVARLEDQRRHVAETRRMHDETVRALVQAREAERALADEKARLALALAEMTRLQALRSELLGREQTARAVAEQANRLKDQFLAMVSHELRTPLNAIVGWADMLRSGKLQDERKGRAFEAIYASARRQAQLIDELLDVARIISGKLRLERSTVDIEEVARGAVEVVQPAADAKRIQIAVDLAHGTVDGDPVRLQQIVWNLLSNAVKFTPEGGTVLLRLHRDGSTVRIVVSDTGPGISAGFLPHVFEPFRQEDGSTTRTHGGLGLGLAIVKHLVELHGGSVQVESDEGGATFSVELPDMGEPVMASPRQAMPAPVPEQAASPASLCGLTVLIVDDDAASREVAAAHLENHGATALTAASASDALELLQRHPVDVLLADLAMPGEDGYSLIQRVRATSRIAAIPAAALTAFARDEDRRQALQTGFQLHLAKPIVPAELIAAVSSLSKVTPT